MAGVPGPALAKPIPHQEKLFQGELGRQLSIRSFIPTELLFQVLSDGSGDSSVPEYFQAMALPLAQVYRIALGWQLSVPVVPLACQNPR